MRSSLKRFLSGTVLLLSLAACDLEEPTFSLPDKTQDGRNTLGFITNGKVWVNHGEICNLLTCEDNVVTGQLHTYPDKTLGVVIAAEYNDKDRNISQRFTLSAKDVTGPGTYNLHNEKGESMNLITNWTQNIFYINLQDSEAKLIITKLDTVNHIVSGEFSGKLYNYNDSVATIDITDGRFDTKLTYTN